MSDPDFSSFRFEADPPDWVRLDGVYLVPFAQVLMIVNPVDGMWKYEIDLDRCRTAAEALDWITQINGKGWATPHLVAAVVEALDYILRPQSNICSGAIGWRDRNQHPSSLADEYIAERIEAAVSEGFPTHVNHAERYRRAVRVIHTVKGGD